MSYNKYVTRVLMQNEKFRVDEKILSQLYTESEILEILRYISLTGSNIVIDNTNIVKNHTKILDKICKDFIERIERVISYSDCGHYLFSECNLKYRFPNLECIEDNIFYSAKPYINLKDRIMFSLNMVHFDKTDYIEYENVKSVVDRIILNYI